MATLTSITGLPQALALENNGNSFRDVSFSSYLNSSEEKFIRKLAELSRNLGPNVADRYVGRKKEEDGEIGVFSAEKYFNGGMDVDSPRSAYVAATKYKHKKDGQSCVVVPMKPQIHPGNGTPSVHSESSWNSQSALLQTALRKPSRRKANKVQGKSFLAGLGCKCMCLDKESVDADDEKNVGEISFEKSPNADVLQGRTVIKENIKAGIENSEHKLHSEFRAKQDKLGIGLNKENSFTFPTINSASGIPIKMEEELKPRKAIEVFGSPVQARRNKNKSLSFDKRLTKMPWDATPKMEEIQFSAKSCEAYNENESDTSSDLFEIESLTGKVAPFLARQGSSATSGCGTPCYAPSEASIEWSVVTASAADFSAMSDYDEMKPPTTLPSPIKSFLPTANQKIKNIKEMPKRRPGILGCKSQKAVSVAGDAHKMNYKANSDMQMRGVSKTYMPVTRFPAETKLTGLDSRPGRHALSTRSLPRPYTPHSSHLLYIQ